MERAETLRDDRSRRGAPADGARDRRREARREQHVHARHAVRCSTAASCASIRRTPIGPIAIGSSSAKGTGPSRTTRSSRTWGSSPSRGSTISWTGAAHSGVTPTASSSRASRRRRARSATASRCRSGSRWRSAPGSRTEQRVIVLAGDAELNEGSNWEAILLAPALRLDEPHAARDRQPQQQPAHVAVGREARAFGWSASVVDGHDHGALRARAHGARRATADERSCADIPEGEW